MDTDPGKAEAALRRPPIPGTERWIGRGASSLTERWSAARSASPLRVAMAIPQWVPGTRLYPLVPPLPVLLESDTDHLLSAVSRVYARRSDDGKYGQPNGDAITWKAAPRGPPTTAKRPVSREVGRAVVERPARLLHAGDGHVAVGRAGSPVATRSPWPSRSPLPGQRRTVVTSRPLPTSTVTETTLGSACRRAAYAWTTEFEPTLSAITTPPGSSFVRAISKNAS
jgi:hypothetical protein